MNRINGVVTDLSAEISARQDLGARVGVTEVGLNTEALVRASETAGLGSTLSLLGIRNGSSSAFVLNQETMQWGPEGSLAQVLSGLRATDGANSSSITGLLQTSASQASQLTTLSSSVGGHTSSISSLLSTTAGLGVVFLLPSPAKIMASVAGLDPKGTLLSVADLPASGAQGDLWIIDGDAWAWSHSSSAWVDMGPRGHSIELRKTATEVQWREVGAVGWVTLMPVSDLVGADGLQISLRVTSTHIQSRLGDGEWSDLIAVSALKGADGRELQMRVTTSHIQTRYAGVAEWSDLIAIAALIGPPGWTAVEATIADGARRVKQIVDWVGGSGPR